MADQLTHINDKGEAAMVDVSDKQVTKRSATAVSRIVMQPTTVAMITQGEHKKGDVIAVARIAGIQAAKKCGDLIPLCHPLMLSKVSIDFDVIEHESAIDISATCIIEAKTGVEMEALCASSIAALTLFDMCKAVDKTMTITQTRVIHKAGGRSGEWSQA